jgi:hypothetical protein
MLILFHRHISTPANIEALFNMINVHIRIGYIRCFAIQLIRSMIATTPQIWRLKINDVKNSTGGTCCFAAALISTLFQAAIDNVQLRNIKPGLHETPSITDNVCVCEPITLKILYNAINISKELPKKTIQRIDTLPDYTVIFHERLTAAKHVSLYLTLYSIITRVIVEEENEWIQQQQQQQQQQQDSSSSCGSASSSSLLPAITRTTQAKRMLIKLGSCHEMFRIYLQQIISGEIWSHNNKCIIAAMKGINAVLIRLFTSLAPLSPDNEMNDLIHCARVCCMQK